MFLATVRGTEESSRAFFHACPGGEGLVFSSIFRFSTGLGGGGAVQNPRHRNRV